MNTDHTDKKGIINKMKICVYRARHASREASRAGPCRSVSQIMR
jgi:hypothetical protein